MSSTGSISQDRWIGRVMRGVQAQVVTSRGILHAGGKSVEYYTSQPSSAQWIALGVVPLTDSVGKDGTHRVLVGTGESEQLAIAALNDRLDDLFNSSAENSPGFPVVDLAGTEIEPSSWFG